jgi:hypothetical protein
MWLACSLNTDGGVHRSASPVINNVGTLIVSTFAQVMTLAFF